MQTIDFQSELNETQLDAVTSKEGAYLVIAGAGSGKTRVLTYRVAYLVGLGVAPESILLLTFTRAAALEMIDKAKRIGGKGCAKIEGGTFHGFCAKILRRYAQRVGFESNFTILDVQDSISLMNHLRTGSGYAKDDPYFPKSKTILNMGSAVVNKYMEMKEILKLDYPQLIDYEDKVKGLISIYRRYKIDHNLMDFDDLLIWARELLMKNPDIAERISQGYRYIMVDEYQDTNPMQSQITDMLSNTHGNLMVVGDDCQSIYGFRGADWKNIMEFPLRHSGCKIIRLEQNYRSTQNILDFSNRIVGNMRDKYEKKLFTKRLGGDKPKYFSVKTAEDEAQRIVEGIRYHIECGCSPSELAVLYRANWISNALERELNLNQIDYIKYGGLKFMERAHVKDVIAFVNSIVNPKDSWAMTRVLNMIAGIGKVSSKKIIDEIAQQGIDALLGDRLSKAGYGPQLAQLYDLMFSISRSQEDVDGAIKAIIEYYTPLMVQNYIEDAEDRMPDLDELEYLASRHESLQMFSENMTLDPPNKEKKGSKDDAGSIVLSTIHQAKGLEWDHVHIIGLNEGQLPHKRSLDDPDDLQEEMRLFYVASTRAKDSLTLSRAAVMHPQGDGGYYENEKSSFLEDMDEFMISDEFKKKDVIHPLEDMDFFTPANKLQYRGKPRFNDNI